ncbi:hypothetical protein [Rheinheimera soli]|uniref:hypothetical protein n=1 Tax=Rheinheimera soli TaxID=443616 RepID=UPI001E3E5C74|nr:hypothetical protein [Rheinheimera soli]
MIQKLLLLIFVPMVLLSCSETQKYITLGGNGYKIPSHYIVSYESTSDSSGFDDASNMVALTFSEEEGFGHLTGQNGWLPHSPISIIIYDEKAGDFEMALSKAIPTADVEFIEFEKVYRVFRKQFSNHWKAIPKNGAVFNSNGVVAERVLECTALGGVDGIKASRIDENIPTSCKVSIKRGNLVIRFSSTEKNLVENFRLISDLVFSKIDSWKHEAL